MELLTEVVNVRLSPAMAAALDAVAEREGRSRGDVVRRLLAYALDGTVTELVSADGLPALSNADAEAAR